MDRKGRGLECESVGQRRTPPWGDAAWEANRADSARAQRAVQGQKRCGAQRGKDEQNGRGGRSLECESIGQRRTPPRANLIQGRVRQASAGTKEPMQDLLRRGNKEGPTPRWKKNNTPQKRWKNKLREKRRQRTAEEWAEPLFQQPQEEGASESGRRPRSQGRQVSAQPADPGARERSRKPRDTCSEGPHSSAQDR